jgi:hypothetical protein
MSLVFDSAKYEGEGTIEKVSTYRDGGLSIPVRVNNDPAAATLLANVNKLCRITFKIGAKTITEEGELMQLSTYRNGGIALNLFVKNEPATGGKWLANAKNKGDLMLEFSSMGGQKGPTPPEDESQPSLENLDDEHRD